jgi:hexosaminidase
LIPLLCIPLPLLVPQPLFLEAAEGCFVLQAETKLAAVGADPALVSLMESARELLSRATGFAFAQDEPGDNRIVFRVNTALPLGPEGYMLEVSAQQVLIMGKTVRGLYYGLQTLRQLLPPEIESPTLVKGVDWRMPAVTIRDEPRFAWRGAMIDVARHLFSVEEIKRFLDLMALHKLNVFHWHLTEDQGWRIEIKAYPKLTEVGAWRKESPKRGDRDSFDGQPYGGFYTQEQVREIVAYAQARFITIVPEIEMPGHAAAAIASHPELGNIDVPGYAPEVQTGWGIKPYTYAPREETFRFLETVLSEIMALFPGDYIHIGGDEAPKDQWKASAFAQQVMRDNKLADEHALQSWFIARIENFLRHKGRRLIGWDEIQEGGLSPTAAMMVWRDWNWATQALKQGNSVVMAPVTHCYLDYYQADPTGEPEALGGRITLEQCYALDPIPPGLTADEASRVLGVQGNLWTESMWDFSRLEYMAFPRLCALAEVAWTASARKDEKSFRERLAHLLKRFDLRKVNYRKLD